MAAPPQSNDEVMAQIRDLMEQVRVVTSAPSMRPTGSGNLGSDGVARQVGSSMERGRGATEPRGAQLSERSKQKFATLFDEIDGAKLFVEGDVARQIMLRSKVSVDDLRKIWDMVDYGTKGRLTKGEFIVAMHLTTKRKYGFDCPDRLSDHLVKMCNDWQNTPGVDRTPSVSPFNAGGDAAALPKKSDSSIGKIEVSTPPASGGAGSRIETALSPKKEQPVVPKRVVPAASNPDAARVQEFLETRRELVEVQERRVNLHSYTFFFFSCIE